MTAGGRQLALQGLSAMLLLCLAAVLSGLSYGRNFAWADKVSLWEDVVRKSPNKGRSRNNLGEAYHRQGRLDLAIDEYARSLALDPYGSLDAYSNLAALLVERGDYDRAIEQFTRLLAVNAADQLTYANRANAYFLQGSYERSVRDYTAALSLAPWDTRFYLRRSDAFLRLGDKAAALDDLRKACGLGDREACSRAAELRAGRRGGR